MTWHPYQGEAYLSMDEVEAWCIEAAAACDAVTLQRVGTSLHGRPLQLLTLSTAGTAHDQRPALWLDGGCHASEWTSVMSMLYTISTWIERLQGGDQDFHDWLGQHTIYALPCVSPDGYQAMWEGAPFLRSCLRPPLDGTERVGLNPSDVDGDGAIRWMRWRHPAGPFVPDPDLPLWMRPRQLGDDPNDAFFFCQEGTFVSWDGTRWTAAPREFGLDLNRNFPGSWAPSRMFGMDGGAYPLSAPESRATLDAVHARPHIALAISNHTYTGAILTQPYRPDTPLSDTDINLMEALATDATAGTGYRVIRVHPDFTYNPKSPIVGVWSDTLTTTLGIPGYTLELWDPYDHCDVFVEKPAAFFRSPDLDVIKKMLAHFSQDPDAWVPWHPFDHPQLGPVELGGIDYMRTFRNPPTRLLAAECAKGFQVADQARLALPRVNAQAQVATLDNNLHQITLTLENVGFLSTASLPHAETLGCVPPPTATLQEAQEELNGIVRVDGLPTQVMHHLDGWGQSRAADVRHPIYPNLPQRGHRATARWLVRGSGEACIQWQAGRAGSGEVLVTLPHES